MYATPADVKDRYGEDELWAMVGEDENGELNVAVITKVLNDAGSEINVYLRRRYELPLESVDDMLVRICADLAVSNLPVNAMGESELVTERAKEARKLLAKISNGTVLLDVDENKNESTPGNMLTYNEPSPFGDLNGF
ncbi:MULTISPECIES: gp436 family protein [unclassified Maridesulfovibrio]|uniref:gp436 family protein n=1 Tax=unclassified Maridesulfovibrio TaxID=2794999 RepID=UPI003B3D0CD4